MVSEVKNQSAIKPEVKKLDNENNEREKSGREFVKESTVKATGKVATEVRFGNADNISDDEKNNLQMNFYEFTGLEEGSIVVSGNQIYASNPSKPNLFVLDDMVEPGMLMSVGALAISTVSGLSTVTNSEAITNTIFQAGVAGVSMNYMYNKIMDSESLSSEKQADVSKIDAFIKENKFEEHKDLVYKLFSKDVKNKYLNMCGVSWRANMNPLAESVDGLRRLNKEMIGDLHYDRISGSLPGDKKLSDLTPEVLSSMTKQEKEVVLASLIDNYSERMNGLRKNSEYFERHEEGIYDQLITNIRWINQIGITNHEQGKVFMECINHVNRTEDTSYLNKAFNFDRFTKS